MQIKSRTETKWGNLRAEHEIMFYSSHPGTETAKHTPPSAPHTGCESEER